MAVELKPGARFRSAVCETEVVVIKAPAGAVDLRCGGHPVVPIGEEPPVGLSAEAGFDDGSLIGKRYTDGTGELELLCSKGGASSLSVGERAARAQGRQAAALLGLTGRPCTSGCSSRWPRTAWATGSRSARARRHHRWPSWPRGPAVPARSWPACPVSGWPSSTSTPRPSRSRCSVPALAGKPFVPINYRLTDEQLRDLVRRTAPATVITGEGVADRLGPIPGIELIERKEFLERTADPSVEEADPYGGDPDSVAVLLYTSGTTGAPKAAVLRNRNLTSYVISTVEFAGAGEDEAAIVSVPPYHIAGISSVLSSTYSGRRVVHVETFEPRVWVDLVRAEAVTHAMVVPTMLNRILDVVAEDGGGLPSLRSLSYGGGPMPLAVIERAIALLPGVGFVNAYGLTETASTIALLGPDDHREAHASEDPEVRARLASVGRPLPSVEVVVRGRGRHGGRSGRAGRDLGPGRAGGGRVRGHGGGSDDGWFNTRDEGHLDEAGFLFVHGRLDDVIVRGGENLSPGGDRGGAPGAPFGRRRRGRRHPRPRLGREGRRRRGARRGSRDRRGRAPRLRPGRAAVDQDA